MTLQEHATNLAIYGSVAAYALHSIWQNETQEEDWSFWFYANTLLIWVFGKAFVNELGFAIHRYRKGLPMTGGFGLPLLGELPLILVRGGDLFGYYNDKKKEHGSVFMTCLVKRSVTLADEEALTWCFQKERKEGLVGTLWPPTMRKLLGPHTLTNQDGVNHKKLRRLMQPYFTPQYTRHYLTVIDETTVSELDRWCSSGEFQPGTAFRWYALRLFLTSLFGKVDQNAITQLYNDLELWKAGFFTVTNDLPIPGSTFVKAMQARKRLLHLLEELVNQFAKENPKDSQKAQTTVLGGILYAQDEDGSSLTRDELLENLLTLVFAGHDTTYASLSNCLYHLSQNATVLDHLTQEVSAFPRDKTLDFDGLRDAPLLNAVLYEAWRLEPPVFASNRICLVDLELQHSKRVYKFPKGTRLTNGLSLTCKDETKFLHGSSEFQVARFLPKSHPLYDETWKSEVEPSQGRPDYPVFGGGPHLCLGKHFAQLEMRILLTRMLQKYSLEVRPQKKETIPINVWLLDFKLTERK